MVLLSWAQSDTRVNLTTDMPLVPKLGASGSIPPIPHVSGMWMQEDCMYLVQCFRFYAPYVIKK